MKVQFNQMLDVSLLLFWLCHVDDDVSHVCTQEQLAHIRSYEDRLNKAKSNYAKALERLGELNNRIYDGKLNDEDGSNSKADTCDQLETSSNNASNNLDRIFDDQMLNDLILDDDNIDTILDNLQSEYEQE